MRQDELYSERLFVFHACKCQCVLFLQQRRDTVNKRTSCGKISSTTLTVFHWYFRKNNKAVISFTGVKIFIFLTVRPRPRKLRRRNLKTNFISTVRRTVHTNPTRKRSFISPVRPTVHTNPTRKRIFSKTPFNPEEFENGFAFHSWGTFLKT